MNNNENSFISRRQLFKKAIKCLPILVAPSILTITSCQKDEELLDVNPSCQDCTNACKGTCFNVCKNTCKGLCTRVCENSCSNSCYTTCSGDCSNSCLGDCSGTSR